MSGYLRTTFIESVKQAAIREWHPDCLYSLLTAFEEYAADLAKDMGRQFELGRAMERSRQLMGQDTPVVPK